MDIPSIEAAVKTCVALIAILDRLRATVNNQNVLKVKYEAEHAVRPGQYSTEDEIEYAARREQYAIRGRQYAARSKQYEAEYNALKAEYVNGVAPAKKQ